MEEKRVASVGGILAFLAAKFDPTLWARKPIFAIFCAIGLTYGFGAVTQANALLDRSPGISYSVIVQGKHINHGKHTSYYLKLSPWGPQTRTSELRVSRDIYDPIQCGDVALLVLQKGAFGLNWYYLRAWQRGENPYPCT